MPDAVPQEDDTPWWVIALIVGGCVAVPLVAVVRMLRCPQLQAVVRAAVAGERIVLRAEGWRMVEQTLVCRRCGETIRRRRREADGATSAAAAAECGSEAGVSSAEVSAEDMRAAASGAAASEAAVPVRNGEKQKSGGQVSNLVRSSVLINVFNNENEPFR